MVDDVPTPAPISRQEALARGLKRYFDGSSCKRGHTAERYTHGAGACVECSRLHAKKWRDNHLEQMRAADRKRQPTRPPRRKSDAERERDRIRANNYYWENRDHVAAKTKQKRDADPEPNRIRAREWGGKFRERVIERVRDWRLSNPEQTKVLRLTYAHRRRASLANPAWADREAIAQFIADCPNGMTIDHIIPLGTDKRPSLTADGYPIRGLHVRDNLQYLPGDENNKKRQKMRRQEQEYCENNILGININNNRGTMYGPRQFRGDLY